MKPSGKIGFFDSGVGGLVVASQVMAKLPQYDYVYLGDTQHKPYGPKPAAEIRGYVQQALPYLFDAGCELVILTCNTASAQALSFIQRQYLPRYAPHRHVLGVIVPAAEAAVLATRTNAIGVLGTQGAVDSRAFAEEIQKLRPEAVVYQQAAPELVSMIESGLHHGPEMTMMLRHYLQALLGMNIDTLVLGCGHYELIAEQVAAIAGPGVTVISEAAIVADRVQDYLFRHPDISHGLSQGGSRRICYTANAESFSPISQEFFGAPVQAEQVNLGA